MRLTLVLLTAAALLGGCSGMRLVESQVHSTTAASAEQPIEAGAHYRFERLPSAQTEPAHTDSVEAIAIAELAEVGLVHDEAQARYSVLLTTRVQPYQAGEWGDPAGGSRIGGSIMIGTGGFGGMVGMGMRFPPPTHYRHEASLLLRDLQTGKVVYETSATHNGPWNDQYNILRAVLAAALKDFPNPPAGPRRVKVEIPR